jgi:hypothetical protein
VLAAILLHVNWRTGEAWPTVATLQQVSGCSEWTVTTAKARLQELGYIACKWREVKGGGHLIRVLFDIDGNRRENPGQTGGKFRVNVAGFSSSNPRGKPATLPTSAPTYPQPEQSQEQSQRTESSVR